MNDNDIMPFDLPTEEKKIIKVIGVGGGGGNALQGLPLQDGLLRPVQAELGKEGRKGGIEISGVARGGVAIDESVYGFGVGIVDGLPEFLRIGQHGLHGAGAEGLAVDHGIAKLGGEGVGHGLAVLSLNGVVQGFGGVAAGRFAREEGASLAFGFEAVFLEDYVLVVGDMVEGLLEICYTEILNVDGHGGLRWLCCVYSCIKKI